jgi:hypothetical protein
MFQSLSSRLVPSNGLLSKRKNNHNAVTVVKVDGNRSSDPGMSVALPLVTSHPRQRQQQLPLSASLAQLNRQKHNSKLLSDNAAQVLYGSRRNNDEDDDTEGDGGNVNGYALELYSDCGESVSSLNDSCFGGASVTGGYNLPGSVSPLKHATSLAVGIVPTLTMSVSDFPSFDTEDVSVVVDVEQPKQMSHNTKDAHLLGTMMPITGTVRIKRKKDIVTMERTKTFEDSNASEKNFSHKEKARTGSSYQVRPPVEPEILSVTSNESHPCDEIKQVVTAAVTSSTATSTDSPLRSKRYIDGCCWFPICLQNAPVWLKLVLLMGLLLLFIASILTILGLIMAFQSNRHNALSNGADDTSPTLAPTSLPLPNNIFLNPNNASPVTNIPTASSPTRAPTRKANNKTVTTPSTSSPQVSPV